MQFSHVLHGQELQRQQCIRTMAPQVDLICSQLGPVSREPRKEISYRDCDNAMLYILFKGLLLFWPRRSLFRLGQWIFAVKI